MYKISREQVLALVLVILIITYLGVCSYSKLGAENQELHEVHIELDRIILETELNLSKAKVKVAKQAGLLTALFGKTPNDTWLSMDTTITWYSLSTEECDNDPDTAAHGKSRPFMVAISMLIVNNLGLVPGDRIAVLSDDGKVAAVVVYWDQKNSRYDDGSWVDIVAPSSKVAARWGIRPGRIVKL
jgi:hypothetical protein